MKKSISLVSNNNRRCDDLVAKMVTVILGMLNWLMHLHSRMMLTHNYLC
jgi:hypothetical protein